MEGKICPKGHALQSGSYCSECGSELIQPRREGLKPVEVYGYDNCPNCGYHLAGGGHGQIKYCPGCGRPLRWIGGF